ncbi:hypothetical protein KCH_75070 [Kitasatospora cheerisanensis KCTC 2395]|uniref:Uncharacterized protein n=1 Tax=Kitasatospora cheerisanensis KCTC 2395 TaxID=1348663 RepID=A0A066YHX9_9ACTN|nr:hypothetical protein KCH_75070 [Kitasatospora cheerisanensis KCTC 2395]
MFPVLHDLAFAACAHRPRRGAGRRHRPHRRVVAVRGAPAPRRGAGAPAQGRADRAARAPPRSRLTDRRPGEIHCRGTTDRGRSGPRGGPGG